MAECVDAGHLAAIVECDTRLHDLLVAAGSPVWLPELWHALDGQMGALMRPSFDAAKKEHYLNPRLIHDNDDRG
jgi:hypothetical protein